MEGSRQEQAVPPAGRAVKTYEMVFFQRGTAHQASFSSLCHSSLLECPAALCAWAAVPPHDLHRVM